MKRRSSIYNLKALRDGVGGSWASTPTQTSLFPWLVFWASIQSEWNIRQMGFANVRSGILWGAVITDKTTKLKSRIPMWPTVACLQQQQNGTICHFFWNQRKVFWFVYTLVYICLHSSIDSSTLVYTRLDASSDSSILVYIRLWLVYIRLNLSTLV